MRVNDSKVGRGYPAEILLTVIDNSFDIENKAPILLSDYGFDMQSIEHPGLKEEFVVIISGKASH